MLTIQDILTLAKENGIELSSHFSGTSHDPTRPPKPTLITALFTQPAPQAWAKLMSNLTEVPVQLFGTRAVDGSGSLDDRLLEPYAAILDEVNKARAMVGLAPVFR